MPVLVARYEVKHDKKPVVVRTKDDAQRVLDTLENFHLWHPICTMHYTPQPENPSVAHNNPTLGIGVRSEDEKGVLWFRTQRTVWVSRGAFSLRGGDYAFQSPRQMVEFPHDSEVTGRTVRWAVMQFVENGGHRPLPPLWWQRWEGPIPEVIQRN